MDSLVRKIEIPIASDRIKKAGLYLVPAERLDELAEIAADAYQNYPLHNWLTNGVYDPIASKLIMKTTLAECSTCRNNRIVKLYTTKGCR